MTTTDDVREYIFETTDHFVEAERDTRQDFPEEETFAEAVFMEQDGSMTLHLADGSRFRVVVTVEPIDEGSDRE